MQKKILNKKWIVAVSGGPDSMALLDMCRENHVDIIVAHVNYHKRKTANRDEKCVRDYCTKYKIQLKVIHPKQKGKPLCLLHMMRPLQAMRPEPYRESRYLY